MFPEEVWENILKYVDVTHLMQLKRVSKHWCEIITRVIERECKWYEKCVKAVPEDTWSSILENHSHPEICCDDFHAGKKYSKIWISLYKSWLGWNTLMEKNLSPESTEIPHFKFSDDTVNFTVLSNFIALTACDKADVIFYDISKIPDSSIFKATNGDFARGVSMGRLDGDVIAVTHSSVLDFEDIRYWNLQKQSLIRPPILRNNVGLMSTSFQYCHMIEFGEERNFLRVDKIGSRTTVRSVVDLPSVDITDIRADGYKTTLISDKIFLHEGQPCIRLYTSDSSGELEMIPLEEPCPGRPRSVFLIGPCIVAYNCFTTNESENSEFGFSINGRKWKKYNTEYDLGLSSRVVNISYHVGLLTLALFAGEVLIISVNDVYGLESLYLDRMNATMMRFKSLPIYFVKLTEYNSHLYLVVADHLSLHVMELVHCD